MNEAKLREILSPLFAQFATADGDMEGKLIGYVIALHDATPAALTAAVRAYLRGEVSGHDGKFLPTSAELARQVRAEQQHLNRIGPPRLRIAPPPEPELTSDTIARRTAKLEALKAVLDETIAHTSFGGDR